MGTRTLLWTAPRCLSTAFERSVYELGAVLAREEDESGEANAVATFHEKFGDPFYYGRTGERGTERFAEEAGQDESVTFAKAVENLRASKARHVFAKEMAYYVRNHMPDILESALRGFTHTFLIRNPQATVPSLYRGSVNAPGWTYFDATEVGMVELEQVFEYVTTQLGQRPIVVDADDLLDDPHGVMSSYCAMANLPYRQSMLSWASGDAPGFEAWPGWHDDVINSKGIRKRVLEPEGSLPKPDKYAAENALPAVKEAVAASRASYERLREHCITATA